jgi:hypothetical protein
MAIRSFSVHGLQKGIGQVKKKVKDLSEELNKRGLRCIWHDPKENSAAKGFGKGRCPYVEGEIDVLHVV